MEKYITDPSRTFAEYLLIPNLTTRNHTAANVTLKTPLVKYKKGQAPAMTLDIPCVSAAMQSVSGERLAIELAKHGGISFIYCSQTIQDQVAMVERVKSSICRGGNLPPEKTMTEKPIRVGAAVNTHDYRDRIPQLVRAGADVLCIDSSDGYSEWQSDVIRFVRENYGEAVKIGAGNVVEGDAFEYLAGAGADFIKVGIGGGAICITREQKGIGRGQASAVIAVAAARDNYFKKTGVYIPLCSDGGQRYDSDIIKALAMGADFVMLGRYFAACEESPSKKVKVGDKTFKEYWGEGSERARNWQRYGSGNEKKGLTFVEGVVTHIPYDGKVADKLEVTLAKIKSTMCNCGSLDIATFYKTTRLCVISPASIAEGGAADPVVK